ncbi:unnamed protein product [Paramecium sonneborni]|uniref:GAF domain-containing protein n=1 Tax=Paramecium sonneborni TaxID=65129 RepID=A0A8S1LZS0_9CILI|nr:unnamed protein product [Paramecium sonneborni]
MSKNRIEAPALTDRSQYRRISQKSVDELNQTLHARINSMVGLDDQLTNKIKQLQLGSLTPKDLSSISLSLQDMVSTLQKVSYNEIMYNQLVRENEKLKNEQSYLKAQLFKFNALIQKMQKEHQVLLEKIKHKKIKKIRIKSLNNFRVKNNFTKRLDKKYLIDALSENEHIKKDAIQKQKDYQKLQLTNNVLNQKLQRLNNRFYISGKSQNEEEFIDQEKMVITFTEIPKNFVFRHVFQNQECKQFIQSALEFSTEDFNMYLNSQNQESKKMQLTWLFNHMVNYRDFSLAHNNFIVKLSQLIQLNNFDEIYSFITTLSSFFKVSHIYLWLRDFQTGFFINVNDSNKRKIMCTKGAFRDSLESREAVNKLTAHKHMMYQNDRGEDVFQDNTYIFPVITDQTLPAGVIEFCHPTHSNNYNDIQYFASILGLFVKLTIQKIDGDKHQKSLLKQIDILQNEFLKLMKANDKFHFCELVKDMQHKVLQLSTSEIVFVEEDCLWKYFNQDIKKLNNIAGVCGQVAINQAPAYFMNISKELNYNEKIDMYSIAPIFIYPIIHKSQTYALIQLSLTNKQIDKYRFKEPLISLTQISNQARLFCEYVTTAYINRFL